MDNTSYEIKPIFKSSANICHDFARIHTSCLSSQKEQIESTEHQKLIIHNLENAYLNAWNMESNVFAFVAYNANEPIGFITGSLKGTNMFTRSLYIMPQYQGYGIGTNLLDSAEKAASLLAPTNMELFSLSNATSFYQNHGYKNTLVLGRVMKIKKLSNAMGVTPVFQWCDKLHSKLNVKIDTNLLTEPQPIFVYVNNQQKIDGVAIGMPNGEQKIIVNTKEKNLAQFYTQKLSEALSKSL